MEIVIYSGGMPISPTVLDHFSLGGSETAALQMAKELKKLGHLVTLFCNLPPQGRPDYIPSGSTGEDGVRYVDIEAYNSFIISTDVDLLIVSRMPAALGVPHQARKAVLWCHDLATYVGSAEAILGNSWNFNEIWAVSEYHRQQIHKVTGYPLERIVATRNGITKWDIDETFPRLDKTLLFSARPERGLENLVRPGGIMERLPDYTLNVTMYENFPQHMMDYYKSLWGMASRLPNVKLLGVKTQKELRQLMHECSAYVYPTAFEEVSCILARECIEQALPFITTQIGALPETLGDCGIFTERKDIGTDEFCEEFANLIRSCEGIGPKDLVIERMTKRDDLYWDGVAKQWEGWAEPKPSTLYSRVWSLIEDSDVIPAIALIEASNISERSPGVRRFRDQIEELYPYLYGEMTFAEYYELYYLEEDKKGALQKPTLDKTPRYQSIADEIGKLPPGAHICDYGCAEGTILLPLARQFPDKIFHGYDFVKSNVDLAMRFAVEDGLSNVDFMHIDSPEDVREGFDAVICSEVLEHVAKPWELIYQLELKVNPGGRVIITVPQGPWEALGLYNKNQFFWRAHIWHINKWMIRKMFADKVNGFMTSMTSGHHTDGRVIGHLFYAYEADHKPVYEIDALEKANNGRFRQTCSLAMIAMNNEDTILRALNSINTQVQEIQIALGPTDDMTKVLVDKFSEDNPWINVKVINVKAIENGKFGFDDARNASIYMLEGDWILWLDTDEYMSGNFLKYTRDSAFDSCATHQHHFTCEPRGAPTQMDKPARLFRNDKEFKFYGKVHEHAEKGFNKGPGFAFMLPDVDIGHIGYVNESYRKARFARNFPLLAWDQEVYPDRKLGMFLWLRDIIHRMRICAERRDINSARSLAEEAVSFYRAKADLFDNIGGGVQQALDYYSEAMAFLGRGIPVQLSMNLPDTNSSFAYSGVFETEEEASKMFHRFLKDERDRRTSGYWR